MKTTTRKFVLSLPGPKSAYCKCDKICSTTHIDHVMPKYELRRRIKNENLLLMALNDPHNLYACCSLQNLSKGKKLLTSKHTGNEYSGIISRAYLYMNYVYNLEFDEYEIGTWKSMNMLHEPAPFERYRAKLITVYTGRKNFYIDDYPFTLAPRYSDKN